MSEKEKEWQKKFEQLEARLNNTSAIVPPSSDEDLEAWVAKYPDVASVVKALADKAANERFKGADEELEELKSMRIEAKKEKAEAQIRKKHSDFDEIKVADEFHDWAEEQPKWIQDAIYENLEDPLALIRAIDLYKADKGLTTSAKKQKKKKLLVASSINLPVLLWSLMKVALRSLNLKSIRCQIKSTKRTKTKSWKLCALGSFYMICLVVPVKKFFNYTLDK